MITKDKYGKLCKEKMIEEMVSRFKAHPDFIITSYMGSSVADLELLRGNLKKTASTYFVVKNSSLKIIFEKLKLPGESSKIDGGMGISLSGVDVSSTCKVLENFAKDHVNFKIKGAVVDGKSLAPEKVRQLASLPTKEILLAQVIGGIKSPITGFVNTLAAVIRKFVYVVDAIKASRETKQNTAT